MDAVLRPQEATSTPLAGADASRMASLRLADPDRQGHHRQPRAPYGRPRCHAYGADRAEVERPGRLARPARRPRRAGSAPRGPLAPPAAGHTRPPAVRPATAWLLPAARASPQR